MMTATYRTTVSLGEDILELRQADVNACEMRQAD